MDDYVDIAEIERLHERWEEALGAVKGAISDSHSIDPVAGCEFHGGQPVPGCGNCFLSDWALNRMSKSIKAMRGQGITMRTLKAKRSHYRFVAIEFARTKKGRKGK